MSSNGISQADLKAAHKSWTVCCIIIILDLIAIIFASFEILTPPPTEYYITLLVCTALALSLLYGVIFTHIEEDQGWRELLCYCGVPAIIGLIVIGVELYWGAELDIVSVNVYIVAVLVVLIIPPLAPCFVFLFTEEDKQPRNLAEAIGDTPLDSPNLTEERLKTVLRFLVNEGQSPSDQLATDSLKQLRRLAEYRELLTDIARVNGDNIEIRNTHLLINDAQRALEENARVIVNYCLIAPRAPRAFDAAKAILEKSDTLLEDLEPLIYNVLEYSAIERKNDPSSDFIEEVNRLHELADQILTGSRGDRPVLLSDINPEIKTE